MDSVVGSTVKTVVPRLYVVVGADRQHEDRPTGLRPHCAGNPVLLHVQGKCFQSSGSGAVSEPLKHRCNLGFRQEGQRHEFSNVLVGTAVCAVGWLQSQLLNLIEKKENKFSEISS